MFVIMKKLILKGLFLGVSLFAFIGCNGENKVIDENLRRQNARRYSYDYKVGDLVSKLIKDPDKLDERAEGQYLIEQVHTNGTVTIRLTPHITERINIRRIRPIKS